MFSSPAIQTGSTNVPDEGCVFQVFPRSPVMQTTLPSRLSFLQFSISTPGAISATWASVVRGQALSWQCQVCPPSLLYIIPELGTPFPSRHCIGKTRVPSCIVIPLPGPWSVILQSSLLTCRVMLTGLLQVFPSSVLFTRTICPVEIGS